jgi:shikimate dehydrogenase
MKIYGIIGRPLGHSFSKRYFEEKFAAEGLSDHRYCNFPLNDIAELSNILAEHPDLLGFNVTIPYKQEIIDRLDDVSPEAKAIGAVNCVKIEGARLVGYNTDATGFAAGLAKLIGSEHPRALVLGTGGASRAVRYVLERAGIEYSVISRTKTADTITYDELTPLIIKAHPLIINTTPLGTWPHTDGKPAIPYGAISPHHFLYDLVYNPPVTAFLAEGRERGAVTINGGEMLTVQAEESWKIWNEGAK